jgi:hypothetical protein
MLAIAGAERASGMRMRRDAPPSKKGDAIMDYAPNFHHFDVLALAGMVVCAYLIGRGTYAISMMRRPAEAAVVTPERQKDHSSVVAEANDNVPTIDTVDTDRRAA